MKPDFLFCSSFRPTWGRKKSSVIVQHLAMPWKRYKLGPYPWIIIGTCIYPIDPCRFPGLKSDLESWDPFSHRSQYVRSCRLTESSQIWHVNTRGEGCVSRESAKHHPKQRAPSLPSFWDPLFTAFDLERPNSHEEWHVFLQCYCTNASHSLSLRSR